jgi:hypothetical protein
VRRHDVFALLGRKDPQEELDYAPLNVVELLSDYLAAPTRSS